MPHGTLGVEDAPGSSWRLLRAAIDGLPANVAILDSSGCIVATNESWRRFADENGGSPARVGPGISYLAVCDAATGPDARPAHALAAGIRAIAAGSEERVEIEYPCHAPCGQRWFVASVSRFGGGDPFLMVAHTNVTARRTAELALRTKAEENALLALVAAHTDNAVIITDRRARIAWVNPAFTRLTGYTLVEVAGRTPGSVLQGPGTDPAVVQLMRERIRAGEGFDVEILNYGKDRSEYWLHLEVRPIFGVDGRIERFVGVETDVTERRRMEEALREERELLAAIIDRVPHHIFWKDRDSAYLGCNQAFASAAGLASPRDVVGLTDFDLAWSEDEALWYRRCDAQVIAGGTPLLDLEETLRQANGTRIDVLTSKVPLRDAAGHTTGLVGICADITERKRVEEALRVGEERWNLALASSGDGVWDWNTETGAVFRSPRLLEILGTEATPGGDADPADVQRMLESVHPDDRSRVLEAWHAHLAGETPAFAAEYRLGCAGAERWVLSRGKVIQRADDGRPRRIVGTVSDIGQRKALEAELAQTRKLESIGSLAAGVAHEINTPVQFVGDNVHFLEQSFRQLLEIADGLGQLVAEERVPEAGALTDACDYEFLRKEIPAALEQSREGLARVSRIVAALKDFSHPSEGERTPVDLNQAIETTLTVCHNRWKYVAELVTDLDPQLPPVPCVRDEINQVVLNLVVNAADAIAEKLAGAPGGRGTIRISTRVVGRHAELRVEDDGNGIPDAIRERIYDPFFTTKEVGKGTGQGLAICHAVVVKSHGGELRCESEPGRGTAFAVLLPLHAAAPEPP